MTLAALLVATVLCSAALPQDAPPIPEDSNLQTTESGLQYSVLVAGPADGPRPVMTDMVKVHYTGWLTNGTVFDSSRERGQPAEFRLGQVIPGWNEGLQLMVPGSRFKFTIPGALAYGPQGRPPQIPPNATLIFDVELLSFEKGPGVPDYAPLDAASTVTTDSGLKYQILEAGSGTPPGPTDMFILQFAFWNPRGKLMDASAMSGRAIRGTIEAMRLPFLKEAPGLMKPGARYRFEVPAALAFGDQPMPDLNAGESTTWEIHAVVIPILPDLGSVEWSRNDAGLEYHALVKAEGDAGSPSMGQTVSVHYTGWLTDGTLFDTSAGSLPASFQLGGVIPGWNQGLAMMKPGDVFLLRIPPALGYGPQGQPPVIPGNATLVFRVELLSVK